MNMIPLLHKLEKKSILALPTYFPVTIRSINYDKFTFENQEEYRNYAILSNCSNMFLFCFIYFCSKEWWDCISRCSERGGGERAVVGVRLEETTNDTIMKEWWMEDTGKKGEGR